MFKGKTNGFQSLTGTIHTKIMRKDSVIRFNPSQVRFTRVMNLYQGVITKMFQSLTGTIHTCLVLVL